MVRTTGNATAHMILRINCGHDAADAQPLVLSGGSGRLPPPLALTKVPARPEPRTFYRVWAGALSAFSDVPHWVVTGYLLPLHISQEVLGLSCEAGFNRLPGEDPF